MKLPAATVPRALEAEAQLMLTGRKYDAEEAMFACRIGAGTPSTVAVQPGYQACWSMAKVEFSVFTFKVMPCWSKPITWTWSLELCLSGVFITSPSARSTSVLSLSGSTAAGSYCSAGTTRSVR